LNVQPIRCALLVCAMMVIPTRFGALAMRSDGQATQAPSPATCAALLKLAPDALPNPTTAIVSARLNAATAAAGNTPALPEHCEVFGRMNERIGFNSQHYAINFHMRLPTAWNGRFFFQGGGGTNGAVGNALGGLQGQQPTNALTLGYAVVSQDSGHDNVINNDPMLNGPQTFAFDPQARIDFGYNSYDQVTQASKALIRAYYGKPPEKSYYVGCSEGGREGAMMTQRFPTYYDGVLAAAPGVRIPDTVARAAWDVQAAAEVAKEAGLVDRFGQPFLNKTFTDEDLALVAKTVLSACDALDGVADGIVSAFARCTKDLVEPKLGAMTCAPPRTPKATLTKSGTSENPSGQVNKPEGCLSAQQINALKKMHAGPRDSTGKPLSVDWPWDAGIGGRAGTSYFQGWRNWKLGAFDATENSAIHTTLVASAVAAFSTPPIPRSTYGPDLISFLLAYRFDTDPSKISSTGGIYTEATDSYMSAIGSDLVPFKNRGGKLLVVHGVSDPIFSVNDSIAWWTRVNAAHNGQAASFFRLFAVPGMAHCTGGPATDQYDAFGALVAWVEKGATPDRIQATARAQSPWPGRTRPLCPHPTQAQYTGSGNIEEAANFVCR
jgi:Tannase and feruloyl esterase